MLDRGYADQVYQLYRETGKGESFKQWLVACRAIKPIPKPMALAVRLAMVKLATEK